MPPFSSSALEYVKPNRGLAHAGTELVGPPCDGIATARRPEWLRLVATASSSLAGATTVAGFRLGRDSAGQAGGAPRREGIRLPAGYDVDP
jgi:hypothetical protein